MAQRDYSEAFATGTVPFPILVLETSPPPVYQAIAGRLGAVTCTSTSTRTCPGC